MAKRPKRTIPLVERIAGIVSLVIVLGTIGYLVFEGFRPLPNVPILTATVLDVRGSGGSFVVDCEIRNAGRGAAADVQIAGVARSADGNDRHARASVDYLPGFSVRRASLIFDVDPGTGADVRIVGYSEP